MFHKVMLVWGVISLVTLCVVMYNGAWIDFMKWLSSL